MNELSSNENSIPNKNWKSGALFLDAIILILIGISIAGGVSYQGHVFLKHAPDLRRGALILGGFCYLLFPRVHSLSLVFRIAQTLRKMLMVPYVRWGWVGLIITFALFVSIWQVLAMRVPLYDVGIFHQILWNLSQGRGFQSTISGAGNFLLDHASVSLALLVPMFKMSGESPLFLPVLQPILLWGGGSAWVYLASRIPRADSQLRLHLAGASIVFISAFDSFWGNLKWGFHEDALGFFFLSWAYAFIFTDIRKSISKQLLTFLFLILAAGAKETLLLEVGLAFLIAALFNVWNQKSLRWISLGIAVFLFWKFVQFELMPHPADKNYFNRYYSYLGSNLSEFAGNIFKTPELILKTIGAGELSKYALTVFLPWLFIPFLLIRFNQTRKNLLWILCIIPSLGSAALSSFAPLRGAHFHYVLELWPLLGCLTLIALASLGSVRVIWIWALSSILFLSLDPVGDWREYRAQAVQVSAVREKLGMISANVAVTADELAGPWIAGRPWITRWTDTNLLPDHCPEIILLRNLEAEPFSQFTLQSVNERCSPGKGEVLWKEREWTAYHLPQN